MENNFDKRLEDLIHRELHKLPDLPAPDTLVSRVRSAIATQILTPWWERPMWTWPWLLRLRFVAILLACLGLGGIYGTEILHNTGVAFQKLAQAFAMFSPLWERLSALVNALVILIRIFNSHFLIYGALLLGLMYLTCAGIGTLYYRLIFAKR